MNANDSTPTSDFRPPTSVLAAPPPVISAGILVVDHLCDPIARLPQAGELVLCDRLPLAVGGCAANVAVDLTRVGVGVGVIGCVGRDPFGQFLIDRLAAEGIETSGIRMLDNAATSGTLIINVAGEDRRFIHSAGANAVIQARDIPIERVRQAKVFYVGGFLLMPALECPRHGPRDKPSSRGAMRTTLEPRSTLVDLFRHARAAGVTTVLDVVVPGTGDHWPKLESLLAETDVFLPNEDEAAIVTGLTDPLDQANRFRDAGAGTVVITQGARGTLLVNKSLRIRAGAYPTQFVGGTGAGDAFDAGYIAGLLTGADPIGCLKWGAALGASCVRAIGASESVFNRDEALAFIKQHEMKLEDAS